MYDKLNDLYNDEIISALLKNDVIIYGKFVRNILIENMSLNDFFLSGTINTVTCYAKSIYKPIITRDLNEYSIGVLDNEPFNNNFISDLTIYTIKYNKTFFFINIIYSKLSSYRNLDTYILKLGIHLDIDCLYIDRKTIGVLTEIYSNFPIPINTIINNIKNKTFKIISKLNKPLYDYIYSLKKDMWINSDNKVTFYNEFTHTEKLSIVNDTCCICYEQFDVFVHKLPCRHYFHITCLEEYILTNLNNEILKCPYCTRSYCLNDLI
jgi:hypothetical protein